MKISQKIGWSKWYWLNLSASMEAVRPWKKLGGDVIVSIHRGWQMLPTYDTWCSAKTCFFKITPFIGNFLRGHNFNYFGKWGKCMVAKVTVMYNQFLIKFRRAIHLPYLWLYCELYIHPLQFHAHSSDLMNSYIFIHNLEFWWRDET